MSDVDILARTLYGEAQARNQEDAVGIACVVLNRVGYGGRYGDTVADVCLKPKQFSCWNPGDPNLKRIKKAHLGQAWFSECFRIADAAVSGDIHDVTGGATHYHTKTATPYWSKGKNPCFDSGAHVYFNNIDPPVKKRNKTKLAVAGTVATAGGFALDQITPVLPVANTLAQYAPWLLALALLGVIIYLLAKKK